MIICAVCAAETSGAKLFTCEVCGTRFCRDCGVSIDMAFQFRPVCNPCASVSPGPSMLPYKSQMEMLMAECRENANRLFATWRQNASKPKGEPK